MNLSDPPKPFDISRQPNYTKRSRKSEDQAAKEVGGKRRPASGALKGRKNDVIAPGIMIEDKVVSDGVKGFYVTRRLLEKLCKPCVGHNSQPMLRVTFQGEKFPIPEKWAMIPLDYFLELRDE